MGGGLKTTVSVAQTKVGKIHPRATSKPIKMLKSEEQTENINAILITLERAG